MEKIFLESGTRLYSKAIESFKDLAEINNHEIIYE